MVQTSFHPFIVGFVLCAVMAATINAMSSQVLVLCSSLTEDFYKRVFRPHASSKELLFMSRALESSSSEPLPSSSRIGKQAPSIPWSTMLGQASDLLLDRLLSSALLQSGQQIRGLGWHLRRRLSSPVFGPVQYLRSSHGPRLL